MVELKMDVDAGTENAHAGCKNCGDFCGEISDKLSHLMSGSNSTPPAITCIKCPETFTTESHLNSHIAVNHACDFYAKDPSSVSPILPLESILKLLDALGLTHTEQVDDGKVDHQTQYNDCDTATGDTDTADTQSADELENTAQLCDMCGDVFGKRADLELHIKNCVAQDVVFPNNSEIVDSLKCLVCFRKFRGQGWVRRHMRENHPEKVQLCDVCGYVCYKPEHLQCHLLSHSAELEPTLTGQHKCEKCGKAFKTERGLKMHDAREHVKTGYDHDSDYSPVQCDKCKVIFESEGELAQHRCRQKHSCPDCRKSYVTRKGLKKHRFKEHHEEMDNLPTKVDTSNYKCKKCKNKNFETRLQLRLHNLRWHHMVTKIVERKGASPKNKNKPSKSGPHIERSPTSKAGTDESDQKEAGHGNGCDSEVQHSDDLSSNDQKSQSFTCTICGSSFESELGLRRHVETHSCTACGKCFDRAQSLRNHLMEVFTGTVKECPECGVHTGDLALHQGRHNRARAWANAFENKASDAEETAPKNDAEHKNGRASSPRKKDHLKSNDYLSAKDDKIKDNHKAKDDLKSKEDLKAKYDLKAKSHKAIYVFKVKDSLKAKDGHKTKYNCEAKDDYKAKDNHKDKDYHKTKYNDKAKDGKTVERNVKDSQPVKNKPEGKIEVTQSIHNEKSDQGVVKHRHSSKHGHSRESSQIRDKSKYNERKVDKPNSCSKDNSFCDTRTESRKSSKHVHDSNHNYKGDSQNHTVSHQSSKHKSVDGTDHSRTYHKLKKEQDGSYKKYSDVSQLRTEPKLSSRGHYDYGEAKFKVKERDSDFKTSYELSEKSKESKYSSSSEKYFDYKKQKVKDEHKHDVTEYILKIQMNCS